MLVYVSSGPRDFGRRPVAPYRRACWEFYAVLRGRIAPVLADGAAPPPPLASDSLWVFAPGHVHGWRGDPLRAARVAVFHFERVAPELARRMPASGMLRVPLRRPAARALARLARELQPLALQPGAVFELRAERAMLDLAIPVVDALSARAPAPPPSAARRVELAERWFDAHLGDHPTLDQVACRLGVSISQLRRLFVAERGAPPKVAFDRLRLARALQLLEGTDLKLSAVAAASGYASASVLVQSFRRAHGLTPDAWRRARAGSAARAAAPRT